jgi:hypothetical protein
MPSLLYRRGRHGGSISKFLFSQAQTVFLMQLIYIY